VDGGGAFGWWWDLREGGREFGGIKGFEGEFGRREEEFGFGFKECKEWWRRV
jgi:hypothetical protein